MKVRRIVKCNHCPMRAEAGICLGQHNLRVCQRADPNAPVEAPGLVRKVANFAAATVHHVAAGCPEAPPEVKAARLATCRTNECSFYCKGDRCGHSGCGCFLAVKTGWADQGCPVGKWGPVSSE